MSPRGTLSRRGFLNRSMEALLFGTGLPIWFARETLASCEQELERGQKKQGPNDRLALAAIGTGGQGYLVMTEAVQKRPNVQLVAACDVDSNRLKAAIAKSRLGGIDEYSDFRELLDRKDIDAVTVVTPDHWHALIAVAAMKAGKDVYCEKPMTLTIAEGDVVTKVAESTGRILQVGTQQRSDPRFLLACELVRNGRLGKIHRVETQIGSNPKHKWFWQSYVPEGLNWEFWQGQAPATPFITERCHYNFRWWYEYSGGKLTDWGAHHNDIAQWGLGADGSGPVAIEAVSTGVGTSARSYACPVDFKVTYTYADGRVLVCSSQGKNGVKFIGENGWIFVDRAKIEASDPRILSEPLSASDVRLHSSADHIRNFIDCVRSRDKPVCDAAIGHGSATVCHLGNIAIRTGKSLRWDPARHEFIGNDEANAMRSRPMRAPWRLEA